MSTADLPISRLMVEVVPDQARSLVFTDLLSLTTTVVGDWTAVVPVGAVSLTVAADGNDLVVSWSGAQARSTLGRAWRLRLNDVDVVGGRVVEALPQSTPGVSSVSVSVSPSVSVSVDVSVLPVGPVGPAGATGATGAPGADGADAVYSDATPAALGSPAPGSADVAAREDHVHQMPSAADVGADPAGTAAGLVAAHVDDTTAAHDASAVSVDTSMWGLSTDVEAALAEVYADGVDRVTALPELADGVGTTLDLSTPGFAKFNRGILASAQSPTSVNTTTAETVFLSETLPAVDNVSERRLRFMISGAFTNNSGSSATLTLRLKHAGGTVATWTWATVTTSASIRAWSIRGELQVTYFGPGFTLLAGVLTGVLSGAPAGTVADFGTRTAVNQAAFFTDGTDLALTVTGQMSVSHANTNITGGLIGIEVIG